MRVIQLSSGFPTRKGGSLKGYALGQARQPVTVVDRLGLGQATDATTAKVMPRGFLAWFRSIRNAQPVDTTGTDTTGTATATGFTPEKLDAWLNVYCTHFPDKCITTDAAAGGATDNTGTGTGVVVTDTTPWYQNTTTLIILAVVGVGLFMMFKKKGP